MNRLSIGPSARLSALHAASFGGIGVYLPFFPIWLEHRGVPPDLLGVILALPIVVRIVAVAPLMALADRGIGPRRLIAGACCAVALVYVALLRAESFVSLGALVVLMALAHAPIIPAADLVTIQAIRRDRRLDYGRIRLWGSIGFIAAVVGVGWLLDHRPIDVLLWVVLVTMVGTLAGMWGVPERRRDTRAANTESLAQVLQRREVMALIAACFLMAVAHGPYYTFFSIHLVDQGYSKTAIGGLWAIGVVAEIAVFAWLPALYRNFSAAALLMASLALAVLRFALIAWFAHVAAALLLAQLLHAATFGVFHSAALASIHRLFRGRNQARGQATYSSLSFGLGGTLGGLGSGWVWQPWGATGTFAAASACALLGFALLLAAGARKLG
jgi:PPP family 3-phenylpropionic acid transporter